MLKFVQDDRLSWMISISQITPCSAAPNCAAHSLNRTPNSDAVGRPMELLVMPKVHNKYHQTAGPDAIYIGRGSLYGNPFVIGKDGNRDEVCDKYEQYLLNNPQLLQAVKTNLKGRDVVCFCAPKRCHGDTLVRLANEA